MITILKQLLTTWNSEKNQRLKLQQAYFSIALTLAVIAGLLTLINVSLGGTILIIAALIAMTYVVNGLAWLILDMIVSKKIDQASKATTRKR